MPQPGQIFVRGSEWRKWDLQVHTPYSALNNGFGTEFEQYAKRLFERAVGQGISVVGVTDYFCIEGYKRLLAVRGEAGKLESLLGAAVAAEARKILLLPNIELRSSVIITRAGAPDARVNYHVVFSDEVPPSVIDDYFLRDLKFIAESSPDTPDQRRSLTIQNLEDLGRSLKAVQAEFRTQSDLQVGMMTAIIPHELVTSTLETQEARFKDKFLLVTAADEDLSHVSWQGQAHLARKLFIQKSHMLFSANPGTRAFGLGLKHPSVDAFINEFKSLKPCVHGSDAHSYDHLFVPAEGRQLWIKADPTFLGLRQVLHEPSDRIFIGATPPSLERIAANRTKVIESVEIRKTATATTPEKWFDCRVPLNGELVAVIGNKGSGKSALADVVGLLGNTPRHSSFAFLKVDRFRDPKDNKARSFEGTLHWEAGGYDGPRTLDIDPESEAVEKVKYVPQNYLEEICNEVGLGRESRFYAELQQVIFSHVADADRLGCQTLDQLLEYRGEEVSRGIGILTGQLTELNRNIVSQEELLTVKHRKGLELQLTEKRREFDAHLQSKPAAVIKPEDDPASQVQSRQISDDLEKRRQALRGLDSTIADLRLADGRLLRKKTAADRLLTRLSNLERLVGASVAEAKPELDELGLTADQIVTFKVLRPPVEAIVGETEKERQRIAQELDPKLTGSKEGQRSVMAAEIEKLQESLTAPERAFQDYLKKVEEWGGQGQRIQGAADQPGTVTFFESALKELDNVPMRHRRLIKERRRKALEILREKRRLRGYYEEYYGAVQRFLAGHPLAQSDALKVTFTVAMVQQGLSDGFLGRINQRRLGHFTGVEEGAAALRRLTDSTDWNSARGALRFAEGALERLKRDGESERDVQEQLVQGQTAQGLYDFLFAFGYVAPIYRLTWDGKGLEQLSPGERGNLLLIFYLLVDRSDIPLVIDQPEENLDNQTVVRTLVPCLKDAKRRRQIVMVTHNPNLAVVCDAEQVIYAEIEKDRNNEVTCLSGAIEDPTINLKILDVLEGTRPAFSKRDARYLP